MSVEFLANKVRHYFGYASIIAEQAKVYPEQTQLDYECRNSLELYK